MTTAAQVRQLVQPLLACNPDLSLVGHAVFIQPVHHVLRGISIDRSADRNSFTPKWAVVFMFEPGTHLTFNWGGRLYNHAHGPWDISNPGAAHALCEEIERAVLPMLRAVETIEDFVAFTREERFPRTYLDLYPHRKIFVDIASGNFESAQSICDDIAVELPKSRYRGWFDEEYALIAKTLRPLIMEGDRSGLARLLHHYEATVARTLKLEKL